MKTLKVISLARSAIKNNLGDDLKKITLPTLLIWGNNDSITPPFVGREFNKLIPNSEIHFIDHCGHAPMMEVPQEFNIILEQFFQKLKTTAAN
jgi:pimeloyl-ACP methyl ester carboxylesterase